MVEETFLTCSLENEVALLRIDRPPLNVLTFSQYEKISETIFGMIEKREAKVVILTGNDQAFITGADIKELARMKTPEQGKEESLKMKRFFDRIACLRRPVIAAIHGNCFGGGLELAMACHLRLASSQARLGLPEISLGTIPTFGGTQRLPRIVGQAKGLELILTGRFISGEEAFRIGLVNEVCPYEFLLSRAKDLALEISAKSALAIEASVQAVTDGLALDLDQGMELEATISSRLIDTHDMKEGLSAFLERRKPVFRNE